MRRVRGRSWPAHRGPVMSVALVVAASGVIGWTLVYTLRRPLLALIVAVALGLILTAGVAARSRSFRLVELCAFVPAFALLTWPPLWVVVVFVRYWITGKS